LVPDFTDTTDGVPFVRVGDLSSGIEAADLPRITPALSAQYRRTVLRGGEILLGVVGYMGIVRIAPPEWSGANVARAVAVLRPLDDVPSELLRLWLCSRPFRDQAAQATDGDTAQPTLGMGQLANFEVALPPRNSWSGLASVLCAAEAVRNEMLAELTKQCNLLTERRHGVITSAVTGQLAVA
jgi:type I restriction enzyme S subunit